MWCKLCHAAIDGDSRYPSRDRAGTSGKESGTEGSAGVGREGYKSGGISLAIKVRNVKSRRIM
jgi:hypothetical protein